MGGMLAPGLPFVTRRASRRGEYASLQQSSSGRCAVVTPPTVRPRPGQRTTPMLPAPSRCFNVVDSAANDGSLTIHACRRLAEAGLIRLQRLTTPLGVHHGCPLPVHQLPVRISPDRSREFYHFGLSLPYVRYKSVSETERETCGRPQFSVSGPALSRDITSPSPPSRTSVATYCATCWSWPPLRGQLC